MTSDHDHADAGRPAQLDGALDLLARGVQHAHAAHEGEVGLGQGRGPGGRGVSNVS